MDYAFIEGGEFNFYREFKYLIFLHQVESRIELSALQDINKSVGPVYYAFTCDTNKKRRADERFRFNNTI